eukprot:3784964-Pyramimonas_sp.AAC.1
MGAFQGRALIIAEDLGAVHCSTGLASGTALHGSATDQHGQEAMWIQGGSGSDSRVGQSGFW